MNSRKRESACKAINSKFQGFKQITIHGEGTFSFYKGARFPTSMLNETTKEFERMKSSLEQLSQEHADVLTEKDDISKKLIDAAEDASTLTKERRRETQVMLEKITSLESERTIKNFLCGDEIKVRDCHQGWR